MKNMMLLLSFLFVCTFAQAQFTITFCTGVSADGKALSPATGFTTSDSGRKIKVLVNAPEGFNSDTLLFKVFALNETGTEMEVATYAQALAADWTYVWKELQFYTPAAYRIKVYNAAGTYLTSANFNLRKL